jgi:hypothetical protein
MKRLHPKIMFTMLFLIFFASPNLFAYNAIEIARSIGCTSLSCIFEVKASIPSLPKHGKYNRRWGLLVNAEI